MKATLRKRTAECIKEIRKCRASLAYFATTYCHILASADKSGAWAPFHFWPAQTDVARDMESHRQVVVLKARQLGFTWLAVALTLREMLFNPVATVLFFSRRDDEAADLVGFRLREMYLRLPAWMRNDGLATDQAHELALPSGSRALAFATTGGRSYTATMAVIDEADYVPDLQRMLNAVKPTVDAGGRLILLSTADKTNPESAFKKIYRAARAGENGYLPIFHGWKTAPWRTEEWYEGQRRAIVAQTGSSDDLHQEYPATDAEALAPRSLDKRLPWTWLGTCWQESAPLTGEGIPPLPGLTVFTLPVPGRRYVIGADPAEGNPNSDDSALEVLDDDGEEVACLAGKVEPSVFARYLAAVSTWYNRAPVLVERQNHGHAVLLALHRDYEAVKRMKGDDGKDGWLTTMKTKGYMYDVCADAIKNAEVTIHSHETLTQLQSIDGNALKAPEGQHDDRATAFALACVARLKKPQDYQPSQAPARTVIDTAPRGVYAR